MKIFASNYRTYKFTVLFIKSNGMAGSNTSEVSATSIGRAEDMIYDEYKGSELVDENPLRLISITKHFA